MLDSGGDGDTWIDRLCQTIHLLVFKRAVRIHLDIPWNVRHNGKDESHSCSPVDAMVVTVPCMPPVKAGHVDGPLLDEPVVCAQDRSYGTEEDRETAHEAEKRRGGGNDLPRHHDPASGDRYDDNASSDVDIFGEEIGQIVRSADDVRREVGSYLRDTPRKADEEGSATARGTIPLSSQAERIPYV